VEINFGSPPLGHPASCRAFIPSKTRGMDLSDLSRFALTNVQILQHGYIFPDQSAEHEPRLANEIRKSVVLNQFLPQKDYVVMVGDPLIVAAVLFVLGQQKE
jgi:hypothetical protein